MQAKPMPLRCSKPMYCAHEKQDIAALNYYQNPKQAIVSVESRNCYSSVFFLSLRLTQNKASLFLL